MPSRPGWITVENYFRSASPVYGRDGGSGCDKGDPGGALWRTVGRCPAGGFLCSDDASFIIGQTIVADGGTTALMSLVSGSKESTNTLVEAISREFRRWRTMLQQLIATLKCRQARPTELYQTDDGTRVLVLPYGGGSLESSPRASDENFLWTNSALNSVDSARAYSAAMIGRTGGDRTWLAPELDFFFPQFPNTDIPHYGGARGLDPGNYELVKTKTNARADGGMNLNQFNLQGFRSKKKVRLEITKSGCAAPDPLRHDATPTGAVEYAGRT